MQSHTRRKKNVAATTIVALFNLNDISTTDPTANWKQQMGIARMWIEVVCFSMVERIHWKDDAFCTRSKSTCASTCILFDSTKSINTDIVARIWVFFYSLLFLTWKMISSISLFYQMISCTSSHFHFEKIAAWSWIKELVAP